MPEPEPPVTLEEDAARVKRADRFPGPVWRGAGTEGEIGWNLEFKRLNSRHGFVAVAGGSRLAPLRLELSLCGNFAEQRLQLTSALLAGLLLGAQVGSGMELRGRSAGANRETSAGLGSNPFFWATWER